jgi:hypothetical protein
MKTIYIQNTIEAIQKGVIQITKEQADEINTKGALLETKSGIKYISIKEETATE